MFKNYEEVINKPVVFTQLSRNDYIGHSEIRLQNINGTDYMVIIVSLKKGHPLSNEIVAVPEATLSCVTATEMIHHIPFKDIDTLKGLHNLLSIFGLNPKIII